MWLQNDTLFLHGINSDTLSATLDGHPGHLSYTFID
jgi:hypothetical protein